MASDIERFKAAGCDDVLAKPIMEGQLLATLARYLATHSPSEPIATTVPAATSAPPESIRLMLAQLSKQFVARLPADRDGLQQELAASDWPQLKGRLHKLKGAAGTFGFPDISALADRVYQQLHAEQFESARVELVELIRAINAVIDG